MYSECYPYPRANSRGISIPLGEFRSHFQASAEFSGSRLEQNLLKCSCASWMPSDWADLTTREMGAILKTCQWVFFDPP